MFILFSESVFAELGILANIKQNFPILVRSAEKGESVMSLGNNYGASRS